MPVGLLVEFPSLQVQELAIAINFKIAILKAHTASKCLYGNYNTGIDDILGSDLQPVITKQIFTLQS